MCMCTCTDGRILHSLTEMSMEGSSPECEFPQIAECKARCNQLLTGKKKALWSRRTDEEGAVMNITMLKGKIHRATVTQAELDYVGSITIDENLMDAAGILEYEKVQVVDINNGNRLETYTIAGKRGSGVICMNGAAARCCSVRDRIIIMSYADMSPEEAKSHRPAVVFVDDQNRISRVTAYEKHGQLFEQEVSVRG